MSTLTPRCNLLALSLNNCVGVYFLDTGSSTLVFSCGLVYASIIKSKSFVNNKTQEIILD